LPVGGDAGPLVALVTRGGYPVHGVRVSFTITRGGGTVTQGAAMTDSGVATTGFRIGTAPGLNEVRAFVAGAAPAFWQVTGIVAAPKSIGFSVSAVRYSPTQDSALVTATVRDTFLNTSLDAVTWVSRNPALVTATPAFTRSVVLRAQSRPGATWVVATSGAAVDSFHVAVTDSSSTPCTFRATPVELAVGETIAMDGAIACIRATTAGAEYALIAHLNTAAQLVSQTIEVFGSGIVSPGPFPALVAAAATGTGPGSDVAFERALRSRERQHVGPRVPGARAWRDTRHNPALAAANAAPASVLSAATREGDRLALNVNAFDFCDKPDTRDARVVAITNGAVVMADVDNPPGGFTDDEYRAFGVAMDSLVHPVDTTAFGAPYDVDGNGRVGILFTRAVNELTPEGSAGGIVLGYYYLRDLLPRQSPFGSCPGSNVAEMFYILVPDRDGAVNSNPRSKDYVAATVVATIAHEYQHLINASRRMYVTDAMRVDEDVWLNEALSHIAEELVFYRASGLSPRANISAAQATGVLGAFDAYQRTNFARYREFLRGPPETISPMGGVDGIAARGAGWSFLRYVADRRAASDGSFWRTLVDARTTGAANLENALAGSGLTTLGALRDWSVSVLADDVVPGGAGAHQQQSWQVHGVLDGHLTWELNPRTMINNLSNAVGLVGGGTGYLRFGVAQGQEALIRAAALAGATLPPSIRLTLLRTK